MKRVAALISVVLLVFSLSACMTPQKFDWKPCRQTNTTWVSEDETIVFHVNGDHVATGTLDVDGELIHIYLAEGPSRSTEMELFPADVLEDEIISEEDRLELWLCTYLSEDKFVAKVENTTFYEPGTEFVFCKAK